MMNIAGSEAWIRGSGSPGSGSTPKCHASGTLVITVKSLALPTVLQVVAALLSLSERKLWSAEIAFTYFKSKMNHHI